MEKKSLAIGALAGTLSGALLAGGVAFASSNLVQAQPETVNYNGIKGSALVYGGTTYAELYAVQQVLKQQGITNQWNGQSFKMTVPQTNQQLQSENQALTQKASDLTSILKNLPKLPAAQQQSILDKLSSVGTSDQPSQQAAQDIHVMATSLERTIQETQNNPGNASSVLQGFLNQIGQGQPGGSGSSSSGQFTGTAGTTTGSSSGTTTSTTTTKSSTDSSGSSGTTGSSSLRIPSFGNIKLP